MLSYAEFQKEIEDFIDQLNMHEEIPGMCRMECISVNPITIGCYFYGNEEMLNLKYPIVYLDELSRIYKKYNEIGKVFDKIRENLQIVLSQTFSIDLSKVPKAIKDKVVMRLINSEYHKEWISTVPHRQFLDLTIVYYMVDDIQNSLEYGQSITFSDIERWGITEEQLFLLAKYNTKRIGYNWKSLYKEVEPFIKQFPMLYPIESCEEDNLFILTNRMKVYGAIVMLYEDILYAAANALDTDIYIIPSSIHELLFTKSKEIWPDELKELVQIINAEGVSPEEKLSDNIYYYDRDRRELRIIE